MNPWSEAEPEGDHAVVEAQDSESFERELFARRARAIEPAVVPSLASILRAAAETPRDERRGRGRAFVATALAAACMVAALLGIPHVEGNGTIVAEIDATAPEPPSAGRSVAVGAAAPPPAGECMMSEERACSEEGACITPAAPVAAGPLFTPARRIGPAQAERSCAAEASCASAPPP